jgi:hypothetical protein
VQEQLLQDQQHQQETATSALRRSCNLKDAQLQQLQAQLLQLQLENQQLLAEQQQHAAAAASCPVCSLQLAPATAVGFQETQQLVAALASKLQRCKQKLTAKRQLCTSLKETNNQLACQLLELKTANAGGRIAPSMFCVTGVLSSSCMYTHWTYNGVCMLGICMLQLPFNVLAMLPLTLSCW